MTIIVSIMLLATIGLLLIIQYQEVHSFIKIKGKVIEEDYGKFVEYRINGIRIKRELLPTVLHIGYKNNDSIVIYANKDNINNIITAQQAGTMFSSIGFKLFDLFVSKSGR